MTWSRTIVGMKSRGVYEHRCTALWTAHRAVESITMDREVMLMRDSDPKYAQLVYNGFWYAPEMEFSSGSSMIPGTCDRDRAFEALQGNCIVVGRKSPFSLYSEDFATFEKDRVYDQKDATGFIRLNALRLRILAMMNARDEPRTAD